MSEMTRCQCSAIFGDEGCGCPGSQRVQWSPKSGTMTLRLCRTCARCAAHGWPDLIRLLEAEKEVRG